MTLKSIIQLLVAIALLAAAGVLVAKNLAKSSGTNSDGPPKEIHFQCATESCQAVFTVPFKDVRAYAENSEGSYPCPECGKHFTHEVYKCSNCDAALEPVGHGGFPEVCPSCGEAIRPPGA